MLGFFRIRHVVTASAARFQDNRLWRKRRRILSSAAHTTIRLLLVNRIAAFRAKHTTGSQFLVSGSWFLVDRLAGTTALKPTNQKLETRNQKLLTEYLKLQERLADDDLIAVL